MYTYVPTHIKYVSVYACVCECVCVRVCVCEVYNGGRVIMNLYKCVNA